MCDVRGVEHPTTKHLRIDPRLRAQEQPVSHRPRVPSSQEQRLGAKKVAPLHGMFWPGYMGQKAELVQTIHPPSISFKTRPNIYACSAPACSVASYPGPHPTPPSPQTRPHLSGRPRPHCPVALGGPPDNASACGALRRRVGLSLGRGSSPYAGWCLVGFFPIVVVAPSAASHWDEG